MKTPKLSDILGMINKIAPTALAESWDNPGLQIGDPTAEVSRGPEIRNSEIYGWFHGLPVEILLYLAAAASQEAVKRYVSLYLTRLRLVRCGLDGAALKALGLMPGPDFGRIMDRLLAARLDGEVSSDDEERALVSELITPKNRAAVL
jgi:hypothetical protein